MIYLDTSVVVALLTPEDSSEKALLWLESTQETLISSDWLITETHSALGLKQRHYGLSPAARQAAGDHLENLLSSCARWIAPGFARRPSFCRTRSWVCGLAMPCIWPLRSIADAPIWPASMNECCGPHLLWDCWRHWLE